MNLENGDKKRVPTAVEEAAAGKLPEKEELTIKTTEVVTEEEPIAFKDSEKQTSSVDRRKSKAAAV